MRRAYAGGAGGGGGAGWLHACMQQAAASLTSEEARQQAQAERLTLVVAENTTGYFGVQHRPGKPNPIRRRCGAVARDLHRLTAIRDERGNAPRCHDGAWPLGLLTDRGERGHRL